MKICVIGDSHAVALKEGYPEIQNEFPDCHVTFFAGHGDRLKALTVADGKLTAGSPDLLRLFYRTSGGKQSIEPVYDAYLLAGVALRMVRAGRLCLSTLQRQRKAGADAALEDEELFRRIHSDFAATLAGDVMTKLRCVTDAPAFLVATPYPGLSADRDLWKRVKRYVPLDRLESGYNAACEKLCAEHGVRFLRQPRETIARNRVTTRESYTRAAAAEIERVSDDTHMNAEYGAIVLRDALHAIIASVKLEN